jgi:hypothetical protein
MKNKMIVAASFLIITFHGCQAQYNQALARALFLLDVAEHTLLPEEPANSTYTITVIGSSATYQELREHVNNRRIHGLPIKLVQITGINELIPSQIIYLCTDKSQDLKTLLTKTAGLPVMIIGEQAGLYKAGAEFSFTMNDNKLKLDVNEQAIKNRNIRLSRSLTEILHKDSTRHSGK